MGEVLNYRSRSVVGLYHAHTMFSSDAEWWRSWKVEFGILGYLSLGLFRPEIPFLLFLSLV